MPHVGRIPSTLEKYRHALSAYLEDITQLNFKSKSFLYDDNPYLSQYDLSDDISKHNNNNNNCNKNTIKLIPDTQTRINHSYNTVKKQLDLLSSYFSLIHDDLHGDLLLLRTNLNLLPSNQNYYNKSSTSTSASATAASSSLHTNHNQYNYNNNSTFTPSDDDQSISDSNSKSQSILNNNNTNTNTTKQHNVDNILNTKQTESIQYIVSILQKFIKYNSVLVEYIHQNKSKIASFWVQNDTMKSKKHHINGAHKLNLDVESIVSSLCVKDLIHTKNYSCHNILFHDILGCANTKQFFTRIYFIVSIWYSFFHALHLTEYHIDDDDKYDNDNSDDDNNTNSKSKPCNSYLTKVFAMTEFAFLTKSSSASSSPSANSSNSGSSSSGSGSGSSSSNLVPASGNNPTSSSNNYLHPQSSAGNGNRRQRARRRNRDHTLVDTAASLSSSDRQSSTDSNSYNWSSTGSISGGGGTQSGSMSGSGSVSGSDCVDPDLSFTENSSSKNDFLLKYLNAQNNYLQSIWNDGIALLEYSLHLLQQQEFRLSCRVAHRCLELFQKQQLEQRRIQHTQNQQNNWNHLNQDLYDNNDNNNQNNQTQRRRRRRRNRRGGGGGGNTNDNDNGNRNGNGNTNGNGGLFMVDPITNQPAQIPGLWYIEMHLANCYHTWGQSNMALYHINRTLDQLGNYQINEDALTVRLNCRRKFKLLSSYLVQNVQKRIYKQQKKLSNKYINQTSSNNNNKKRKKKSKKRSKKVDNIDDFIGDISPLNDDNNNNNAIVLSNSNSNSNSPRKRSFMKKIKINNRRRRKSNVFAKLFDRFSGNKKKTKKQLKASTSSTTTTTADDIKDNDDDDNVQWNDNALYFNNDDNNNNNSNDDNDDVDDDNDEFKIDDLSLDLSRSNQPSEPNDDDIKDDDDLSDDLQIRFVDDNDNNPDDIVNNNGHGNVSMITLEALLSMHMTKGRILIEMKLLSEALDLYTYIINECESLIKYHALVNPHHVELEKEFELVEEEKYNLFHNNQTPNNNNNNHGTNNIGTNNRNRRRRNRRNRDNDDEKAITTGTHPGNNTNNYHHGHHIPPSQIPNTPYRRLTKNIGLENYYAARGDIYFKFKDLKNALCDFSNAIKYGKCKKEMGIYYNLRGVCFHEMKQYDRALKDYDNAVKSMYGNHVAWNNRAALLVDMRMYDDAIENANNAIKLDPSYGNAYKHRGVAYHLKCDFEKATTDINRCIKLLPNYRPARLALLAIWKDIFECVRIIHIDESVPLDLVKIVVDYTVGNGYEIDEYMVNFTYC